ncbi:SH2 domain-containing protein 4B [Elysia marginata]|uniref:SH2 domain-containing protein 4B n=1 Tax=Elysia marginata TaxID=1093978 RepID=A0AAV4I1J7_9GAST|nr:SH2 domain-containing protein 4B [Elysia marginata]
MLQQILEQMYIEPELLEELSEDQKQMLFYKMRQEQVRKWKLHEAKMDEEEKKNNKSPAKTDKKKVDFLKGRDGCEWVWVMGEHTNDKSIEQILEEEAHMEAQKIAEAEAQAQREKEEAELHRQMEEEKQRIIKENEERELRIKKEQEEAERNKSIREAQLMLEKMELEKKKREEEEKKRIAEIEAEEKRARRRSREITESMKEKRSSEIFSTLQRKRMAMEQLAEESRAEVETKWKEQEQKAKEAEVQLRESARKARVEYNESLRRSFTALQAAQELAAGNNKGKVKPPLPPKKHLMVTSAPGMTNKKPRPLRPKNREMIVSWFQKEEEPKKAGLDPETGKPAEWFHGIINRKESEDILEGKETGAFIVRVSERVWGYTLSYKESSRLKHFLIDASDLGYQFFGADQTIHTSLVDLVNFHKETPITVSGQEKLSIPCGQIADPPNYADLFVKKPGTDSTS